jgi:hypothetical protein
VLARVKSVAGEEREDGRHGGLRFVVVGRDAVVVVVVVVVMKCARLLSVAFLQEYQVVAKLRSLSGRIMALARVAFVDIYDSSRGLFHTTAGVEDVRVEVDTDTKGWWCHVIHQLPPSAKRPLLLTPESPAGFCCW